MLAERFWNASCISLEQGRAEPRIGASEQGEGRIMKIKAALLTGMAGLMLSGGMASQASAQYYGRSYNDEVQTRRYMRATQRQARQIVRQAYRDVLRREADASGLQQYMDAMLNRGWSEADVRRSLMESDEYAQRMGSYRYNYNRRGWRFR